MPRIRTTRTAKVVLSMLAVYVVFMIALGLFKFIRTGW
jgi:hypothetical protein